MVDTNYSEHGDEDADANSDGAAKANKDGTGEVVTSDDNDEAENCQADCGPGAVLAEETTDKVETEAVQNGEGAKSVNEASKAEDAQEETDENETLGDDALGTKDKVESEAVHASIVNLEDWESDSDGASEDDEYGTEEADTYDEDDDAAVENEVQQVEHDTCNVYAE